MNLGQTTFSGMQHWDGVTHDEQVVYADQPGIASRHVDEYTAPRKPHDGRQERKAVELCTLELNQHSHKV